MSRFNISRQQLEKTLARGEESLNLIGYIPVISSMSAAVRALGGKLQALIGFGFAVYSLIAGIRSSRGKIRHFLNFSASLSHFVHGLLNMLRAAIEAVPFLSLVTCLPYDRFFHKRFKYATEDSDIIEIDAEEIKS